MSSYSWLWNLAGIKFVIHMLSPGIEVKVPPTFLQGMFGFSQGKHSNSMQTLLQTVKF